MGDYVDRGYYSVETATVSILLSNWTNFMISLYFEIYSPCVGMC